MLDFLLVTSRTNKNGTVEVYPKFRIQKTSDLMIRGGDFYAVWVEDRGLWSTDEQDALKLIDRELDRFVSENASKFKDKNPNILYMWDSENGMIDRWHKYCQKQMRDDFKMLDEDLIFSNIETARDSYASKKLSYPLDNGPCPSYEKLVSTLYSPEERHKLEWAIGAVITGDSKKLQKFMVLYGGPGTGKSTVLNIMEQLFEGYFSVFDAKSLGSANNSFALEAFKTNPLVAIQHDGDLSRIEDNTRLNSLVSHEMMTVNEKFKSAYATRFKTFLFMGTNKPVKITDAKSGIIRRLIDVTPSGNKLDFNEYDKLVKQTKFELGAIAYHCKEVYLSNPGAYDNYIPIAMLGASNDFYNYIIDSYHVFKKEDGTTLKAAWEMYKNYCEEAKVSYVLPQRSFKEELKNYFRDYKERFVAEDGSRIRSYYTGFRTEKFESEYEEKKEVIPEIRAIEFTSTESIFDVECAECPAQYGSSKETPTKKWENVKTKLANLDTSRLHYVRVPENHIVIDFDIKDEDGNKSFEKNLEAASKWPETYAELSKSGSGIHLHYIYTGDVSKLCRVYDDEIEIKVFMGNSSLRRKLTKCNNLPIASISSGLPLKGEKMINSEVVQTERGLRTTIKKCINKEIHPGTKPSVDFIYKILEDAYRSDLKYDVSDLKNAIVAFAANSTHQADYCLKLVSKMHFKSEETSSGESNDDAEIVFYDVEVFPNLFLVNWKFEGEGKPVVRMINPTPSEIEDIMRFRLVGFNCRRYDNHILYGRLIGYTNEQLYELSQKIVSGERNAFFGEAYNVSYTDVYDFCSKKQSLKKWEIELGIHHQELGLPWDQPVPEELWTKVAEYCDNDVIATEAVFNARKADFVARQVQVALVKLLHKIEDVSVNDTTNTLSTKIIFGNNRKPQSEFNYRDLSKPVSWLEYDHYREAFGPDYVFRIFDADGLPTYETYTETTILPEGWSILPFFPGYTFDHGKSIFMGEEIGEGGKVYSEPGMYVGVWDGDIASQHPHSAIFERLFGPRFTKVFEDIVKARVAIKHKDFDAAGKLLGGALVPYLNEEQSKDLAQALKIVINSIYGLTSASFENPFRDPRNIDNIVAKRGALFMTLLKSEVQKRGFQVCHIKTDSIKIPNATQEIQDFVIKFGKEYGYTFETEAIFEKFCLVNDAVYVAKEKDGDWTATGTQFSVPYVFKKLFTHEPIEFDDMCETKSVSTSIYLDMNENLSDVSALEKDLEKFRKKQADASKNGIAIPNDEGLELEKQIKDGHDYHFVGRIGRFCPVKPGANGGLLMREKDGKYYAVGGTKGYRWLESETVRVLERFDDIDRSYYDALVDEAVETIGKYGDFEWFASDDHVEEVYPWTSGENPDDLPWYEDDELFNKR